MSIDDNEIPRAVASIPKAQGPSEPLYEHSGYQVLPSLKPLYSVKQMRWAAALGGPLAATCLMSLNFKRLKQSSLATKTLIGGVVVTALYFTIASLLPDDFPSTPFWVVSFLAAGKIAEALQGKKLLRHGEAGGKVASNWGVFGWIMGAATTSAVAVFAIYLASNVGLFFPDTVRFGSNGSNEVVYEEASKLEAMTVGLALEDEGYFSDDAGAGVRLVRKPWGLQANFYVRSLTVEQMVEHEVYYQGLSQELALATAGPIELRLLTTDEVVKQTLPKSFPDRCVHPDNCYTLAGHYRSGDGVAKSPEKYAEFMKQACDDQHLDACFMFADANYFGEGIPEDHDRFLRINHFACYQGGWRSCEALGEAYMKGYGTEVDLAKAEEYLIEACGGGGKSSCKLLDRHGWRLEELGEVEPAEAEPGASALP